MSVYMYTNMLVLCIVSGPTLLPSSNICPIYESIIYNLLPVHHNNASIWYYAHLPLLYNAFLYC